MVMRCLFVSFLLVLAFAANSAAVKVLHCKGGEEVRTGDTTYAVMKKCGQPAYQETVSAGGCEKVEKWHYDCQGRHFTDVLVFKAGVLTEHIQGEKTAGVQMCN